jgi:hypothetical protein
MTPGIPDLAEIVEVDDFGRDPETPQHDDVQQWCRLAPTEPFGRPHEREKRERGGGAQHTREERRAPRLVGLCCASLSSWAPFI